MRRVFYFLLGTIFSLQLSAQSTIVDSGGPEWRKYSNEFLKIGVGARAFGMGNAMTSAAEDVTAGYWNPAGLVSTNSVGSPEVSLMHSAYFANLANYNYIGYAMPLDSARSKKFGISLIRLGVDNIPNTLNLLNSAGEIDYSRVKSFSSSEFAALFTYAWRSKVPGLSFGTNFKIIYRGIGVFGNGWGFGLDAAAKYQRKNFSAGLNVLDATNTFTAYTFNTETFASVFQQTGNEVPLNSVEVTAPTARLGAAYNFQFSPTVKFLLSADNDFYFDGKRSSSLFTSGKMSIDPRIGGELAFADNTGKSRVFLRGGMYNIQRDISREGVAKITVFPTAGVGFNFSVLTIDYALANIGNFSQNLYSHVVSLKFHFTNFDPAKTF